MAYYFFKIHLNISFELLHRRRPQAHARLPPVSVHTTLCLQLPTRQFWKTAAQDRQESPDHCMGE